MRFTGLVSISNGRSSYPSGIVGNKIGFRFVFTEDVGWVESGKVRRIHYHVYLGKKV